MVKRLIPLAEKTGVVLALENVWNHLWVKPAHFRHFVASFQSQWVQAYFDIGNHVKYGPPEEWILTLGSLLRKVHVKDFRLNPADPDGQGSFVNIRDGNVRWPIDPRGARRDRLQRLAHHRRRHEHHDGRAQSAARSDHQRPSVTRRWH